MDAQSIDVNHLTELERQTILDVINKDRELRKNEENRIKMLKNELRSLRLKGVIKTSQDVNKTCTRCRQPIGALLQKSYTCIQCRQKICEKCQEPLSNKKSICCLCSKQLRLEGMTGQWFYAQYPKRMRNAHSNAVVTGAELAWTALNSYVPTSPDVVDDGSVANGANLAASSKTTSPLLDDRSSLRSYSSIRSGLSMDSRQRPRLNGNDDAVSRNSFVPSEMNRNIPNNLLNAGSGSMESIVSAYSAAGEANFGKIPISGEIEFGISFSYKANTLEVHIKQCRNLAPVDVKHKRSDPYVKTYLLPDKTRNGKRKTKSKRHTLNPVFDETVKYHITKSELETRTLCVMVWHSDRLGRNDFLGEVNIHLDSQSFNNSTPKWYKLQERASGPLSMLTYKGDLNLALKYITGENVKSNSPGAQSKGELQVLAKQARNLTAMRASGTSDTFCKGYLLPDRDSRQKSPVIKKSCNPSWNFTFVFENVSLEELKERGMELSIWDHDRFTSNDFLGGVRLNLGTGKSFGKEVDWMDSTGEEVALWRAMLDRPNSWIEGNLLLRVHMSRRK